MNFNDRADELMDEGRDEYAATFLHVALLTMPPGWTPRHNDGTSLTAAFWNEEERDAFASQEPYCGIGSLRWANESFSKAWCQLARVLSNRARFDDALFAVDSGLALEPDHPGLWNERGSVLGKLKRREESLECYIQAATIRPWAPSRQVATALWNSGVALTELDRLDEAEVTLRRCLELDPRKEKAVHQLEYIESLRRRGISHKAASKLIWSELLQGSGGMESDFNNRAEKLIASGRLTEARAALDTAIRGMPADWKPSRDDGKALAIAFWHQEESLAFVDHHKGDSNKSIFWVPESYSRAWYQLAAIAVEKGRFEEALFCLERGMELEPDHPELWCEKGYVLGHLKRHSEALDCYVRADSVRDWAPASYTARALRGQGVQLIDLNRLEEAEAVLKRSLEYEPHNEGARNELGYVTKLRSERKQPPWFLDAYLNPPTDPLTVRLLALVGDLPSIPGPKTVGTENYSRIARAFRERGWLGFEEEFDRVVPRSRPDYADVKRDLLREPLFMAKVHRRMSEEFTGQKTADEVWDEILREHDRKPKSQ